MNPMLNLSRRQFIGNTLAVSAAGTLISALQGDAANRPAPVAKPAVPAALTRKIKIGLIGCGGRGMWLGGLFKQHGGYVIHAVCDYFQDRAKSAGDHFIVDAARRFSGLSGYKRLIESGVEAVAVESPPYFHPEQAAAAVDAGKHVYCAKPVAIDVPGCHTVETSGKKATEKKLVFLVDFQTRTDRFFIEAMRRVHAGGLGKIAFAEGIYHAGCPWQQWVGPLSKNPRNPEMWLHAWGLDKILSGDIITEQNIHTLDVLNWALGETPLQAAGSCGLTTRPNVGTCADHFACFFQYPNGVGVTFSSRQFAGYDTKPDGIRARVFGSNGVLETEYGGNVMLRGISSNYYRGGNSPSIYQSGAVANIATFYENVIKENFENTTVTPSVQSNLITILGRTAAYSGKIVTWEDMLTGNEHLEADLKGLKS